MHLSFLPIGTSGVPPAKLLWFEGGEVFLILLGAVVLAGARHRRRQRSQRVRNAEGRLAAASAAVKPEGLGPKPKNLAVEIRAGSPLHLFNRPRGVASIAYEHCGDETGGP